MISLGYSIVPPQSTGVVDLRTTGGRPRGLSCYAGRAIQEIYYCSAVYSMLSRGGYRHSYE